MSLRNQLEDARLANSVLRDKLTEAIEERDHFKKAYEFFQVRSGKLEPEIKHYAELLGDMGKSYNIIYNRCNRLEKKYTILLRACIKSSLEGSEHYLVWPLRSALSEIGIEDIGYCDRDDDIIEERTEEIMEGLKK